jgi:uncharacterized repeat protein (TIGR04052 family)
LAIASPRLALFVLLAVAGLTGCSDDEGGGATASGATGGAGSGGSGTGAQGSGGDGGGGGAMPQAVTISFAAKVGDQAFACESSFMGLGAASTTAALTDFRLYVHDVRVVGDDERDVAVTLDQDGAWQYQDVALLDFEDKSGGCANGTAETHTSITGTIPGGIVVAGLKLKVGVPDSLNHADAATAPSPLSFTALFWNWAGGYKFIRIDAMAEGNNPFLLHVGSTGCTGDPEMGDAVTCSRPNVPEIELDAFDPASSVVIVDYGAAVADADLSTNGGGPPGCMSDTMDPECAALFPKIGLDLDTGAPSPATQALFRVE